MSKSTPPDARATARNRAASVRFVTWTGLVVNLLLAIFKFVAGALGHSQAVVADGAHSLSDLSTDLAVLIGVRYWSAPADDCHPHGHQRIETLVTALIGAALVLAGAGIGFNALRSLRGPHTSELPGWVAFWAAIISIVSKELLYRWSIGVGKRVRSPAVMANAWHHRSDSLSSIPAALAVAGSRVFPDWYFLDHVGAVMVSIFILQAAWRIVRPALGQLVDEAAPPEVAETIKRIALETDGVMLVHAVRTRFVGPAIQVDLHILVEPNISVQQGHDISENVQAALLDRLQDVADVVVHIEPYEEASRSD